MSVQFTLAQCTLVTVAPTHSRWLMPCNQTQFHVSLCLCLIWFCKYSHMHMRYIQSLTSLTTRETRAHRTQDVTTPSTPTTTPRRVGSLPQGHPGLWGTLVGPGRTPTVHRCVYGGRPWVARRNLHGDDQRQQTTGHRQASRQTCLQRSGIEKREQSYC